jgi:hypothetical protein
MSTLSIHSSSLSHASANHGPSKFLAFFSAFFEVFGEAQDMARAAHKRYPFSLEG